MTDDFRSHTIRGVGWSTIAQLVQQGLRFIIGIMLARLLSPNAFGLMGMVTIFVGFANIFRDLGFGAALIHNQNVNQRHYSSIFWVNVGFGLLLTLLFTALAPVIGAFYGEAILIPLTILISLNFFIGSLNVVQNARLQKTLDFRQLAILNTVATLISGAIAILLALLGFGVWSLAIQSVLATLILVSLMWYLSDWRPSFQFDLQAVRELMGFSSNLLGFNTVNYWVRNADNLLIGRVLGAADLGLYTRAYALMLFPLNNVSRTIGRVMFPALSRIQNDTHRVQRVYLRMTAAIALITFPLMLGLLVVADDFVMAIYGEQWAGMIPILQLFCIVGMLQSVGTLNGNIYLSQGQTALQFKVGSVIGIVGIIAIVIGLQWGVVGVAFAYTAFSLAVFYPSIRIAVSLIELSFLSVVRNMAGIFGCAFMMALLVWALGQVLPPSLSSWVRLLIQVVFGVIVYLVLLHLFKAKAYNEIKALAIGQWRSRNSPSRLEEPDLHSNPDAK